MTGLDRRFEALVFDWDGTAVPDRDADATRARDLVEALCAAGVHIAIVSGTHVGNVDGQLQARPSGPGRLLLALNRGSEVFAVDAGGPHLIARREATAEEDAALTDAAEKIVNRLAARGLEARIVSQRLNRRKIDLIPLPEWEDPPKARIDELLRAVEARLRSAGINDIATVVGIAEAIAAEEGLPGAKITSDAKHVEVGLTDKTDASRAVFAELWNWGIAPDVVCIAGDEFGPLGGLPGSDALMIVPEAAAATVASVGVEPNGVPAGVMHVSGGPDAFLAFMEDQLRRRADVPGVVQVDGWSVLIDGLNPVTERACAARLALADGTIGTTAAPLLAHTSAQADVMAAGVYDGAGASTDLLPLPRWALLGGELGEDDLVHRVLDLHTATLRETVRGTTAIDAVRFLSFARPGLAVLRAQVEPADDAPPLLAPAVDAAVSRGGNGVMTVEGSGGSVAVAASQTREGPMLNRLAAFATSSGDPLPAAATAKLHDGEQAGFDVLLGEHRRVWAQRWARADVEVAGDPEIQLGVRLGLYHLMGSVADDDEAAVGARGLTGHAYRGHVFWDADLFVTPFLVATHPAAARAMLEYRIRRLPAALERARAEGLAGARFPWESARTGEEVTPVANRDQAGRLVPIRTGSDEIHIVGDVAWAACFYADWTGDEVFASGPGLRILIETARYWSSRVRVDRDGRAHLYGVIGPDEYHEPVDDNMFTNVLARWNLRRAATAAEWYGDPDVQPGEAARWQQIADALVDGYSPERGVYEQFAGFFGLEPVLVAEVAPRRPITADLLLGRERVRGAQIIKQADVLMAYHLLPDEVAPELLESNLDFYEPRTAHGSSLSPAMHASVMARAGRMDDAVDCLRLAAGIDVYDLTSTGAGGVHIAAMGGVWQAIAFGFMGLRAHGDALIVDPKIPRQWNSLGMHVFYRGVPLSLRADAEALQLRAEGRVTIEYRGRRRAFEAGEHVIPLASGGAQ